jgi:hypothetical protein
MPTTASVPAISAKQAEHSRVEARLENRVRKDLFHGRDAVGRRLRVQLSDDLANGRDQRR